MIVRRTPGLGIHSSFSLHSKPAATVSKLLQHKDSKPEHEQCTLSHACTGRLTTTCWVPVYLHTQKLYVIYYTITNSTAGSGRKTVLQVVSYTCNVPDWTSNLWLCQ